MWGLPQKKNARRADKIRLCGHLRRYKKIVKKTYIIYRNGINGFVLGNSKFFTRPGKSIEKTAINFAPSKLRFLHLNILITFILPEFFIILNLIFHLFLIRKKILVTVQRLAGLKKTDGVDW